MVLNRVGIKVESIPMIRNSRNQKKSRLWTIWAQTRNVTVCPPSRDSPKPITFCGSNVITSLPDALHTLGSLRSFLELKSCPAFPQTHLLPKTDHKQHTSYNIIYNFITNVQKGGLFWVQLRLQTQTSGLGGAFTILSGAAVFSYHICTGVTISLYILILA